MPELRKDPFSERWVVIAPERGKRPSDFQVRVAVTPGHFCPFCPGNEAKTPGEVLVLRPPGGTAWSVRVVPNLFPALKVEGALGRSAVGLYDRVSGVGAHEVIIETPDHAASMSTAPPHHLEDVLWSWRERIVDLARDERLRFAFVFKNHGAQAGATLEHEHSQLVALPLVPADAGERFRVCDAWYAAKERCLLCDLLQQDRRGGELVVYENDAYLVVCPWTSRSPFQVRIAPKEHRSSYEETPRAELAALADALHVVLRKLDEALERPPYNLMLHSYALRETSKAFHWHIDLAPALTRNGGFEYGTGTFINPTPPEDAAEFLRKTAI